MKFKCLMWVSSVVAFASVVLGEGSVRDDMDQKIEKDIVRMGLRGTFSSRPFDYLLRQCEYDSNRLCRVAQDVYMRHGEVGTRHFSLWIIEDYGDTSYIPFLETCVTNQMHGCFAMRILNRFEGFTSNSVDRVARFHSVTNQYVYDVDMRVFSERSSAIKNLAYDVKKYSPDNALKSYAISYVLSYASNNCYQAGTVDRALISIDPGYEESRRRLAFLRYALPRSRGPYLPQYIADEIGKLEAYPEADLPE